MFEDQLQKRLRDAEPLSPPTDRDLLVRTLVAAAPNVTAMPSADVITRSRRRSGSREVIAISFSVLSLLACIVFGFAWRDSQQTTTATQLAEFEATALHIEELKRQFDALAVSSANTPAPTVLLDDIRTSESLWMLTEAEDPHHRIDTSRIILAYYQDTPAAKRCRDTH